MKRETYVRLHDYFAARQKAAKVLIWSDRILTAVVYVAYPALLAALLLTGDPKFRRCFWVPLSALICVSIFRKIADVKRPYEVFDTPPTIPKEKHGESFPSRHVFSVFMIACTFLYAYWPLGLALLVIGLLLAVLRVAGGVHFPKDVLTGACIGILAGVFGFWLI